VLCLAVNYYYLVHTYSLPVVQGVLPKCLAVLDQPVQAVQPKKCTATRLPVPVFQDPQSHLGVVEIRFKTPPRATCSTLDFHHWIDKVYFLPMEVFWTHYKPRLFPHCSVPDRKSPNLLHTGQYHHIQILSDMSLKALNFPHQQSIWLVNQMKKFLLMISMDNVAELTQIITARLSNGEPKELTKLLNRLSPPLILSVPLIQKP
jgi:hypothetical protein